MKYFFILFCIISCTNLPTKPITVKDKCALFKTTIPADWIHDDILVPEDFNFHEGPKIKVFYYGKLIEGVTPIVLFNGGPNLNSHYLHLNFENKLESVIYFDQRGTGCSDPYPIGKDEKTLLRLQKYGSSSIVADAEAIRKKLIGDKKWIAFGQSYGGFIARRYLMDAPKGLKSVFIHGINLQDDPLERFSNRIEFQNRVFNRYLEIYPNDLERLNRLADYLQPGLCLNDPETNEKVCGLQILGGLSSLLPFRDSWETLHLWIEALVSNNRVNSYVLTDYATKFLFSEWKPIPLTFPGYVIAWTDYERAFFSKHLCLKTHNKMQSTGKNLSQNPLNECLPYLQVDGLFYEHEKLITKLKTSPIKIKNFATHVQSNPEIKIFLYSSELDSRVPKEAFKNEVRALKKFSNFTYVNLENSGHEGFMTEVILKTLRKEIGP